MSVLEISPLLLGGEVVPPLPHVPNPVFFSAILHTISVQIQWTQSNNFVAT